MKRCSLSGIYIFDTLDGEEKRSPTCIEDCKYETRDKWLNTLEKEALVNTVHHLCDTLKQISEQFGITSNPDEE